MKKIILACLIVTMLFSMFGCSNRAYLNLVEEKTNNDILYVGVRSDLTIVSNVYSEVDLKELGLASNAYFICGNDEYMYFGVQQGTDNVHIEVMEYSFKDNSLLKCSEINKGYKVASIDGETFYYFKVDKEFTWKGYEYTWLVYKQEKGNTYYEEVYKKVYDAYPTYAEAAKYISDYMAQIAPYAWVHDSSEFSRITYITNGTDMIQPQLKKSEDDVLKMIVESDSYITTSYFTPTANGESIVRVNYDDHDNFFLYTYDGDFEFMFAEKVPKRNENRITAIYTITPQQ